MAVAQARERLEARVTADQKKLLKEAASARGVSLTDFIVNSAQEAALAVLREQHLLELSRRDQEVFVDALLRQPEANERLRAAAARFGYLRERA